MPTPMRELALFPSIEKSPTDTSPAFQRRSLAYRAETAEPAFDNGFAGLRRQFRSNPSVKMKSGPRISLTALLP